MITSTDTTEEYYLKSGSGRDIGIYDIKTNEWEWYVQGTNRVAKISPDGGQQPDSISYNGYPIGSHLVASFYQYDHLGNTRVVYTPSERVVDDSTCTVEYTLEYVGDYYPYGKTLREFVNGDREKFLTTQHERDVETGLDYRGARFYDGDIARFLSLDPLAMDYPSLSDYSYVAGNPIRFIDPTGMAVEDYYVVDSKGNVKLEKKTDHDFDLLYRRDENGDYIKGSAIKIKDKSLLSGLSKFSGESTKDNLGNFYFAHYGISDNKEETFKLFKYLADNTDVEWSVASYETDGEDIYYLGTYKAETIAPGHSQKFMDEKMLTSVIHSHPDVNGTEGASGDEGSYYTGDMQLILERSRRFKKWGLKLPTHYVYHKHTQIVYKYTPYRSDIFIGKVQSYKFLMTLK